MKFGLFYKGDNERISLYETSNPNLNTDERWRVAYEVFRSKKQLRDGPFQKLFDVRLV